MHGTIVTTAPETLPQTDAEQPEMAHGALVNHGRFGPGKVKDVHNGVALVHFSKGGDKKVRAEFLPGGAHRVSRESDIEGKQGELCAEYPFEDDRVDGSGSRLRRKDEQSGEQSEAAEDHAVAGVRELWRGERFRCWHEGRQPCREVLRD